MEGMTDLEILRAVLARELDTINAYSALARQAQDPSVRALLEHISRDEEEHVAECIQWISRMNPVMASFLARQPEHVSSTAAPPAVILPVGPAAAGASSAAHASSAATPGAPPGGAVEASAPLVSGSSSARSEAASMAPHIDAALGNGRLLSPRGLTVGSLYGRRID